MNTFILIAINLIAISLGVFIGMTLLLKVIEKKTLDAFLEKKNLEIKVGKNILVYRIEKITKEE